MRHELETDRFYLARYYSEAVEAAGGVPVHLSLIPRVEYVASVMGRLDGVLLPGSASDVDPLRFGQEPHPRLGQVHPLRDETDSLVLAEVEARRLPLFAICYGMQIWNVERGGTLIQDITSQWPEAVKHEQGAPRGRRSHSLRLLEGSLLAELAGGGAAAQVNSHHHQAIERLGASMRATAWSPDGLVEGVEDIRGDRWAVGVQWHPEIDWQGDGFSTRLFGSFVEAARAHAATQTTLADAEEGYGLGSFQFAPSASDNA